MADKWFHPRDSVPSRERAEEVLAARGMVDGLFLVRESSTADGDFVLSVVHEGSVIHYQIRRRGEDALFSLSEEKKARKKNIAVFKFEPYYINFPTCR